MPIAERASLYNQIEQARGRPLIVYVTSMRRGAEAQMAQDVIPEILAQLELLPRETKKLDFFIVSNGGDPTVAWRIVSLIRERVSDFSVLVPQAAFSAATLIALGANEIVMHPNGNLGPTDPQITNHAKNIRFGSQDLVAFLKFARSEVGLSDQAPLTELFKQFCSEVGSAAIGVAARSGQLAQSMGERLLLLHMKSDSASQKAKVISEALNTKFFHHGYAVGKSEAHEIGLPVAKSDAGIEELMWKVWTDIQSEFKFREPFAPVRALKEEPACAPLFGPVILAPTGGAAPVVNIPPAKFMNTSAAVESCRSASRFVVEGEIFGLRTPDLNLKFSVVPEREGWVDCPVPQPQKTKK